MAMAPASGFQLAVAYYRQGQLALAAKECQAALKRDPRNANGLQLLGVIQFRQGEASDAVATFDRMLKLQPNSPDALMHRGLALRQLQRFDEALSSIDKALKLRPGYAEALNNRGTILKDLERFEEAREDFEQALKIAPDSVSAQCNLAAALRDLKRYDESLAAFDRALALQQASREALNLKGRLLYFLKRYGEAIETFERLLKVDPTRPWLRGLIFELKLGMCDWRDYDATVADISARIERGEPAEHPLNVAWYSLSPAVHRRCAEIFAARAWPPPRQPLPKPARHGDARIRIAYFSPDFREHPISYMFAGLIDRHDRAQFEVHGVSFGWSDGSSMRARLEKAFDRFHDVRTMSDRAVAELIRREKIDIVIDLAGFTASNRGAVLALRPAPITVNYQGFGIAAPFMDYVIADAVTVPDRLKRYYHEKVVRMPETWMVTDDKEQIAEIAPSRASQELPENGFVFCAFNGANKISPAMFASWLRIVKSVEGSALWLRYDNDAASAALRRLAEAQGIAGERVAFARRMSLPEHLARHRLAGLFLDTFPYGAHTTASHALWAGLPVLTMASDSFVSRVGASLLQALGLPELVVESPADYEKLAIELARDPARLSMLQKRLMATAIEYEESGWYDGQVWEKPVAWRQQDLLVATHEVRPVLLRLQQAMAITAALLLAGSSLCQAL